MKKRTIRFMHSIQVVVETDVPSEYMSAKDMKNLVKKWNHIKKAIICLNDIEQEVEFNYNPEYVGNNEFEVSRGKCTIKFVI